MSIVDVEHDWAHLLDLLTDDFLLLCIFIQELRDGDVGPEEIFLDSILVLFQGLSLHGRFFLRGRMREIAVLDVAIP